MTELTTFDHEFLTTPRKPEVMDCKATQISSDGPVQSLPQTIYFSARMLKELNCIYKKTYYKTYFKF